jgi:hypothetical protein
MNFINVTINGKTTYYPIGQIVRIEFSAVPLKGNIYLMGSSEPITLSHDQATALKKKLDE